MCSKSLPSEDQEVSGEEPDKEPGTGRQVSTVWAGASGATLRAGPELMGRRVALLRTD